MKTTKILYIIIISILFGASITYGAELILSSSVFYDNNKSNLSSTTVQDAIDELYEKCNVERIWEINNPGTEVQFNIPVNGTYKLEIWGAEGGKSSDQYLGGPGGYSVGKIKLNIGDILYINIGTMGNSTSSGNIAGGYNGGGNGYAQGKYYSKVGSGGGATHIATTSGLLSSLNSNIDSILIVSGGGGGASEWTYSSVSFSYSNGGSGGGTEGTGAINKALGTNWIDSIVSGGNQTSGGIGVTKGVYSTGIVSATYSGTFGKGASATGGCGDTGASGGGGAGGGFYGGGVGGVRAGAGGSGYIGNSLLTEKSMYCYNCTESNEESTKTISTTCANATATPNCAKLGNGYARITLIS